MSDMSKDQIKFEINKVLDQFTDRGLEEILVFLKKLEAKTTGNNADILKKILKEDSHLLERLAK